MLKKICLSPEMVQESLYAFSYDLENKLVKPHAVLFSFIMGILIKGNVYLPKSPNYENPQQKARRLYLAKIEQEKAKNLKKHCLMRLMRDIGK